MSVLHTLRRFKLLLMLLGFLAVGLIVTLYFSNQKRIQADQKTLAQHTDHGLERSTDAAGRVVWTCSMHPQIQLPEPGKCPICFMDLIKLELDANKAAIVSMRQTEMNTDSRKLAEIVVTPVRRQSVALDVRMVGKVEYDESRVASITAWMGGRIDKLFVDATGTDVHPGQPMASIYSPELLTAQAELLQAAKAMQDTKTSNLDLVRRTTQRTLESSREKLRLLGLSKAQIDSVIANGKPTDHIILHAQQSGVVIKKDVVEGMYVQTGMPIYTIADFSHLWVVLDAYESDLPWIREGLNVEFSAEASPGRTYKGRIVYIDPMVNPKTRTVGVRLEVPNTDGSLKPGMFVQAIQKIGEKRTADSGKTNGGNAGKVDSQKDSLVIPASAPLITGKRAVVYVQPKDQPGVYIGREVVLGARAGDTYVVRSGLEEGELVVSKGSFKIDSALQIQAKPSMMNPGASEAPVVSTDMDHTSADSGVADHTVAPKYVIPEALLSKLYFLGQHITIIDAALRNADIQAARALYTEMSQKLDLLTSSSEAAALEGDAKLAWNEYAMLLTNDAVLGAEAKEFKRIHEIHALIHTHFANLSANFGVTAYAAKQNGPSTPEPFRKQVGAVYAAYAPLTDALGKDDAKAALTAAASIKQALASVDMTLLDAESHTVWMDSLKQMSEGLTAIENSKTKEPIDGMRAGFEIFTLGLTKAVMRLGVFVQGPLYELRCPMAFDGKGATWLQQDEDVRNPYYGAAMYKCGNVTRQLKAE